MKKFSFLTFLLLFNINCYANINNNVQQNNLNEVATFNNTPIIKIFKQQQIKWLDKYLESIILKNTIKKIDLQLKVYNLLNNQNLTNDKTQSLFFNDKIQLQENINCIKILKNKLEQQLSNLLTEVQFWHYKKLNLPLDNDFQITKILNTTKFDLTYDSLQIVNSIIMYQNILNKTDAIITILSDEIAQNKRSELDIHFILINKLDNEIYLKKFLKIYLIEKLNQIPTMETFNEINNFLNIKLEKDLFLTEII